MGSWELHSPLKAPEANSLQEFLHTEGQSYMQATYLLPEKPELRMGLGRELVELDSALVPISSTLVCGVRHTPKPFHLTRTVIMLLLEPKHARWGSSLTWQSVGLGTKHKVVGPCCQQRPFFRTTPGRKKTWGLHIWAAFYRAAPRIGSRTPAIFTEGCSTVTETHT